MIGVMDATAGQSLYPLHHSKTIHLVRHAQGVHNVEGEKNHDAYLSDDLFDANLTPLGWKQVFETKSRPRMFSLVASFVVIFLIIYYLTRF
ncbi:hypothetical protein P8452_45736 [Trifolium repens]|nr:hypothetical protein P8452_45736 [Trifolium repens]